jgi:hypothetical protein
MSAAKNIFLIISLIFLDQLSKYMIRHFGGFYICNSNIAFGIKVPSALFYALWICIVLFFLILANRKFKITNPKQYQNPNNLNSKHFRILDFGNLNLFRIWNLGFRIFGSYKLGLLLILSGAVANIIDRLIYGCVIDFIDLKFWPASNAMHSIAGWPVFNLADSFIVLGVILILLEQLKKSKIR